MKRRHAVLIVIAAVGSFLWSMFNGWRFQFGPPATVASLPPRSAVDVASFVRGRVEQHMGAGSREVTFDPLTILSVLGLVMQILKLCGWDSVARQQRIVKRHPTGRLARQLKARLLTEYEAKHPDTDQLTREAAVNAAVNAFADATPDELRQLHDDLNRVDDTPTPLDLSRLAGELGRLQD